MRGLDAISKKEDGHVGQDIDSRKALSTGAARHQRKNDQVGSPIWLFAPGITHSHSVNAADARFRDGPHLGRKPIRSLTNSRSASKAPRSAHGRVWAAYYTHETGVCRVLAVKRASGFNAYGDDHRQAADSLVETLTKKYGAFEKHDYLLPGSILHEPNEWLTAIRKGERVYGYYGLKDDLEDDLLAITVQATFIGLMLEYLFNNFDACREAASDASLSDL